MPKPAVRAVAALLLVLAAPTLAAAAEPDAPLGVEVDGDPAAFVVDGFSLHVGVVGPWRRIDFGVFSIDEPAFLHGNEGWSTELRGWGLNWELIGALGPGFFAGVGATLAIRSYALDGSGMSVERHQLLVGPHVGWRFQLGRHLYLSPWLAVEYAYRGDAVTIAGKRFDDRPYVIFPTVYLGWRF
jgi:hypothetical protein